MTNTPYLGMPFIEGSQAQKHITHNEALRILDAAIQIGVLDTDRTAPPSTPTEGDRHIVASGATGAWAGQDDAVTVYEDGAWRFLMPKLGWCAWSDADGALLVYDGAAWTAAASGGIGTMSGSVAQLGINDTASDPNLLTVKSNAALFNAVGVADGGTGDMRVQISKEGSANIASVVFSDAFSGRAEFGLVESDAFKLKVSNDGSTFVEAITFDQSTGNASLQRGVALTGVISPSQITSAQNDYAPSGFAAASTLRLSSDASRNVTGLAGGADGRTIIVHNVGSQTIVLTNQDAASTAANRFLLGGNVTLAANASLSLRYDGTTQRWRAISPASSSGGSAAGMTDTERQNSVLGLIYQSKSLGDIRRLVNLFATGFKASSDTLRGIVAGSSSNYDVTNAAASGYVLPTATVSGTTVTINSADTTVAGQTYTFVDRTTALVNSVTVSRIGWYSTVARSVTAKIVKRNSANNYDVVVSQMFTHTGSGWEDFTLTSPYAVPGSGSYYLAGYVAAGGSNPNVKNTSGGRAYINADLTGTGQATAGEDTGSTYPMRYTHTATSAPADMTLVTAVQTADSSVSTGRVLIEYDNTAAPALNTDLTVEISANGGTNWTSATLSAVTSYSQGSRKVAETADTALTSGTSFQARIKTLDSKSVPIYGVGLTVH